MEGHYHSQNFEATGSSAGSNSSNSSISGPEDNHNDHPEISASAKAAVASGGTASGITNSGRWSNEEHERFLTGLEQFGTGNWKRITELVGTRSCTQVRTHAQKYFQALKKPPLPDGSTSGVATKTKKPKASGRKKSKLLFEHLDSSSKKISANNTPKRGLSGMSLLAQAAMVDPEFDRLDQTVDEYDKTHPQTDDDSDDDGNSSGVEDYAPPTKKAKQNGYMTPGQEIAMLRAQLQIANESVELMKKEVQATEARAVDAIEGRNIAIKECRELQEMNSQLKMEQARILMAIESSCGAKNLAAAAAAGNGQGPQAATVQSGGLDQMQAMAGLFGHSAMAAASAQTQQFQQQIQQQDQIVIEVLQSRLKEAEIRYHAVTESLARQTQVLTDQHRAILELNCKLEKERSLRENAEMELGRLKRHAGGK